ncbi:hypothetical protein BD309DRAFT_607026 [Dichomitus squalens]|nr:hypothetical protein BD309DRAFT_607026 [Dichomitus squalens]
MKGGVVEFFHLYRESRDGHLPVVRWRTFRALRAIWRRTLGRTTYSIGSDWAGAVFANDGCPGDCTTYVDENPSAFTNAYFDVAGLKVYQ